VEVWIQFGRGPLFAASFAIMVLGLARILALSGIGVVEAYKKSWDRILPWRDVARQSIGWMLPLGRLWRCRPVYSTISFLFHIGLLLVPLFAAAHVQLWRRSVGFAWRAIPGSLADVLTILTLVAGVGLILGRVGSSAARGLSRAQDYFWPILLLIPFATGYACVHAALSAKTYQELMLLHVYAADLIMLLIPFTKIAHCVLAPISQIVTAVAWKFPPGAGDKVAATLGYADRPTWMPKSRLEQSTSPLAPAVASTTQPQVEAVAAKQE
jgi:nitrate reductase gamma subunit